MFVFKFTLRFKIWMNFYSMFWTWLILTFQKFSNNFSSNFSSNKNRPQHISGISPTWESTNHHHTLGSLSAIIYSGSWYCYLFGYFNFNIKKKSVIMINDFVVELQNSGHSRLISHFLTASNLHICGPYVILQWNLNSMQSCLVFCLNQLGCFTVISR